MGAIMEIVKPVVDTMICYATTRISEQFGYLTNYHNYVKNLEDGVTVLQNKREEIKWRTDDATHNLQKIEPEVEKWFQDVDILISETQKFFEDDQVKGNHRCFKGWCINLWSRYKYGKEACKKATEIANCKDRDFATVSHHVHLPEISHKSSRKVFSSLESRMSTVMDIMKALDDESVHVIGVCGMGGVGKTKIVEEVRRQAEEKRLFDLVAMVTVSQDPSMKKIQDDIAHKLSLDLKIMHDLDRASALWTRIKQEKKMLIILDDVWSWLELEDIGIPLGEDHPGCKIVLTSRSEEVCNNMDAQKIFRIQVLEEQEAWALFRETVGEKAFDSTELNTIARQIVRGCGGLPLAIETIGRELKNQNMDIWIDAASQLKMPIPANIEGMKFLYSRLESSYHHLKNEEAKFCFLLFSLFQEDACISVELLLQYGVGLNLFKGVDTIEDSRIRVHARVRTLLSSFLLMEVENKDGYVKMHGLFRKVAVLITSDENSILYGVKVGSGQTWWLHNDASIIEKYKGISLMTNYVCDLPEGQHYPQLEILLLDAQDSKKLKIPENFFVRMKNLKVLDLSCNNIESLPASIARLLSLRTLVLNKCKFSGDRSKFSADISKFSADISIIGTLKQLQILNFAESDIKEVPENFNQLTLLRFFDLSDCSDLEHVPQGVISKLVKLEEFYIGNSFSDWVDEGKNAQVMDATNGNVVEVKDAQVVNATRSNGVEVKDAQVVNATRSNGVEVKDAEEEKQKKSNASLAELRSLTRLTNLIFRAKKEHQLPRDFKFQDLLRFEISVGSHFDFSNRCDLSYLHKKKVSFSKYNEINLMRGGALEVLVKATECLFLKDCKLENLQCLLQLGGDNNYFHNLKHLEMDVCGEMEYVVDKIVNWAPGVVVFPNLECLKLHGLLDLGGICHPKLPFQAKSSFSKIQRLSVSGCHSMLNIVPSNLLYSLQCLEYLEVVGCFSLQNVFDLDGLALITGEDAKELLSRLVFVKVNNCYTLSQIFPSSLVQAGLVRLKEVVVRVCYDLEEIFGTSSSSLGRVSPSCLQNLTQVEVWRCYRLRNIFPPFVAQGGGLANLKTLKIMDCSKMEVVLEGHANGDDGDQNNGGGGGAENKKKIVFPHLYEIQLIVLQSLTCFCKSQCAVEYPSLEEVTIISCPNMETFGYGAAQITPKLKKVQIGKQQKLEEIWMEDLNATVSHMHRQTKAIKAPEGDVQSSSMS